MGTFNWGGGGEEKGTPGGKREAVRGQTGGCWGRTLGPEEAELPRGRSWGRVTSAGSSSSWGREHAVRTRPLPSKPHPHEATPSNPTNQPPGCTQKPRPACTDHAHRHLAPLRPPRSPITAVRSSTQSLHTPPTNHSPRDTGPAPSHTHPCFLLGGGVASPPGAGRRRWWAGLILATPPLLLHRNWPGQEAGATAQGGGACRCPAPCRLSPASFPTGSAPTAAGLALAAVRPLPHLRD